MYYPSPRVANQDMYLRRIPDYCFGGGGELPRDIQGITGTHLANFVIVKCYMFEHIVVMWHVAL